MTYLRWSPNGRGLVADLVCPQGHLTTLLASWAQVSVEDQGVGVVAFRCPYEGCQFDDVVELLDFDETWKAAE